MARVKVKKVVVADGDEDDTDIEQSYTSEEEPVAKKKSSKSSPKKSKKSKKKKSSKSSSKKKSSKSSSKKKSKEKSSSKKLSKSKKSPDEPKTSRPRQKITVESFTELSESIVARLDEKIEKMSKSGESGIRFMRSIRKDTDKLRRQIPKISKTVRQTNTKNKISGLVMKCEISDEMIEFLGVEPGTFLSRTEINAAMCVYVNIHSDESREKQLRWAYLNPGGKRDLQDPENRKRIIPDKKLAKILRWKDFQKQIRDGLVSRSVKDKRTGMKSDVPVPTDDDHLWYYWIQKLIGAHIIRTVKVKKE